MKKNKDSHHLLKLLLTTLGLSFVFVLIMLLVSGVFIGHKAYQYVHQLSASSQLSIEELKAMAQQAWNEPVTSDDNRKNILILGVDSMETRGDSPVLTDTIMFASLNLNNGTVTLLPLPRDLWSDKYQTKINALYQYGLNQQAVSSEQFVGDEFQNLFGLPLHHILIMNMDQVAELVDIVEGVEVDVETSFTDELFPRTDVDVTTETRFNQLYETITFDAGPQQFDGQTALKFMRSRKSVGPEGNDLARSKRQQLVMQALVKELIDPNLINDPNTLGELIQYYQTNFSDYLSLTQLGATIKMSLPVLKQFKLITQQLPVAPENKNGVIFHPESGPYGGQWVYAIIDPTTFKQETLRLLQY